MFRSSGHARRCNGSLSDTLGSRRDDVGGRRWNERFLCFFRGARPRLCLAFYFCKARFRPLDASYKAIGDRHRGRLMIAAGAVDRGCGCGTRL